MSNETKTDIPSPGTREWLLERGGIINIRKPSGLTSHDVVGRVRRHLAVKKVGHTGTLDPMATGVLPVCVGRGTRIIEYLDMDRKSYLCTMRLGRSYDTQDVTGEKVGEAPVAAINAVTREEVAQAFSSFHGVITQWPPLYSAVKVDGKKLYEYARAGETELIWGKVKPRNICIWDLTVESMDLGKGYDSEVTFSVVCSKGTYIRAICQEAGERLGVGAAMAELTRTGSGYFTLEDAVDLEDLERMGLSEICSRMKPPEEAFSGFGEVHMTGELDIRRITSGMPVWTKHVQILSEPLQKTEVFPLPVPEKFSRTYLAYGMPGHIFLGVVTMDQDGENLRADKIFTSGAEALSRIEETKNDRISDD